MKKQYYYGRQYLDHEDWNECLKVLQSDYLSQGPILEKFESTVAKYFKVNYCVAVSSATAALHLGCRALGIHEGDTVWTTSLSFVSCRSNSSIVAPASIALSKLSIVFSGYFPLNPLCPII